MKERLELVTDFATLKAGMIVVANGCGICRRGHRGILTGLSELPILGEPHAPKPWKILPLIHMMNNVVVSKSTVDLKLVYRVVDGLEQTTETRKAVTA